MTTTPRARLLVVEDRDSVRRMLDKALRGEGYEVVTAADGRSGIAAARDEPFDLVLTDLKLPYATGLEVLAACRELSPAPAVVVMTGYGTVSTAVEAMKLGALDFLEKPVDLDDLFQVVAAAVGEAGESEPFAAPGAPPIVGSHPRLKAALHLLRRVAATDSTVLLTGPSGSGKEVFARALHGLSSRRGGPFVAVNCAAIPETLIENELFGHEKGAFTGADRRQPGRFEAAAGGTLLLDEIGELSPAVQAKVLRVLEERVFERVGGGAPIRSDARLVAATNRDLGEMVAAGTFRSDLFYRLEVFPIALPTLAERASDVPALARHLLSRGAERSGSGPKALTPAAEALLVAHDWPGNVRELANLLERATILIDKPRIDASDLEPLMAPLAQPEEERIKRALAAANGDRKRAAEELGISLRTLQRKIRRHSLEGFPQYRD